MVRSPNMYRNVSIVYENSARERQIAISHPRKRVNT